MMRETSAGEVFDDIIRRVDRNLRMMSGEHIVVEERFPEGVEILARYETRGRQQLWIVAK